MPKFHIHVYPVYGLLEYDIEAEDRKAAMLIAVNKAKETPIGQVQEADCAVVGFVPGGIEIKGGGEKIVWHNYRIRKCYTLHICKICSKSITDGHKYYDGGYGRRAHVTCVNPEENDERDKDQEV